MIHFIVGTEAELIKVFPIMLGLNNCGLKYKFIATGQHNLQRSEILHIFKLKRPDCILYKGPQFRSMFKMVFWFFGTIIKADTGMIFGNDGEGIVLVYGDTVSTLLGVALSKRARLKVAHLEAGLRSNDITNLFPEEIIRRLVSKFSDIHFAPGEWAYDNLEKYRGKLKVDIKQNTLLDSFRSIKRHLDKIKIPKTLEKYFIFILHRTENLANRRLTKKLIEYLNDWLLTFNSVLILHHATEVKLENISFLES